MSELKSGALLQGGKYKIEKSLGQGGFGITYLAEQTNLGRKVCIKEFFMKEYGERTESSDADSDATVLTGVSAVTSAAAEIMGRYREKFVKEARTIARLDHPGIVRIHDVFEENGTAYYVMDYIEGENLNDLVKREGALSEDRALGYIRQVGDALTYVHGKSIMHLDVKPSNVIVRKSDGNAILIDFGTAKQYDSDGFQTSTTPIGLSAGYAPIELMKIGGVSTFSPETDVYSLGASLYYLVTGQNPPEASVRMEMLMEGDKLEFPKHISSSTIEAIETAMQSRKQRPHSILDFLHMLSESTEITSDTDSWKDGMPKASVYMPTASEAERKEAVTRYEKAAEQGDPNAQDNLGESYLSGWGVEKNEQEAVKWFRKAAEQGLAEAQQNLGICVYQGWGIDKNEQEAVEWFKKAAEQGFAEAQTSLGMRFLKGYGIKKDAQEAVKWFRKAVDQGDPIAQAQLAGCYLRGDGIEMDEHEAVEWYRKAAEQGLAMAQGELGWCYQHGRGVPQDYSEAVKWFKKAANQGYPRAQTHLGQCYLNGYGIEKNVQEAVILFEKARLQLFKALECANTPGEQFGLIADLLQTGVAGIENEHEYVDLGLPSGTKWATCNIGASVPMVHGDFFAWGETSPKRNYDYDNYIFYKKKLFGGYSMKEYDYDNATLSMKDDTARRNWGGKWRMPTSQDFKELLENTTLKQFKKVACGLWLLTSRNNGASIVFPSTGFKSGGYSWKEEDKGFYWCSGDGSFFEFNEEMEVDSDINVSFGLNIRPVF